MLRPDPEQPRKTFERGALDELKALVKIHGITEDLVVTPCKGGQATCEIDKEDGAKTWMVIYSPEGDDTRTQQFKGFVDKLEAFALMETLREDHYLILSGERRWRVAVELGLAVVPCKVVEVEARRKFVRQFVANLGRENLSALDEAAAFAGQIAGGGFTPDSLAVELGVSRGTMFARLALNRLHPPVRLALTEGKISTSVAGLVATVPTLESQGKLLKQLTDEEDHRFPYSFRNVQKLIELDFSKSLRGAAWKLEDGELVPAAGPCTTCPKRAGNMLESFPELKNRQDVCTDVGCYRKKLEANTERKLKVAREEGQRVLTAKEGAAALDRYGNVSRDYLRPDDHCGPLGWEARKTWKEALGKQLPAPVLMADARGEVHELIPKEEALAALKASGLKMKVRTPTKEDDAKEALEEEIRAAECAAITEALVATVHNLPLEMPKGLLQAVVPAVAEQMGHYHGTALMKRRGWKVAPDGYWADSFRREVPALNDVQCLGVLVELAASRDEDSTGALAKALGVDVKKVAKAARAEAKKPTPKPAAAESSKKANTICDLLHGKGKAAKKKPAAAKATSATGGAVPPLRDRSRKKKAGRLAKGGAK